MAWRSMALFVTAAPELLGDNDEQAAAGALAGEVAILLHLSVERGQVIAAITRGRPGHGAISQVSLLSRSLASSVPTERELALSQLQRRREREKQVSGCALCVPREQAGGANLFRCKQSQVATKKLDELNARRLELQQEQDELKKRRVLVAAEAAKERAEAGLCA